MPSRLRPENSCALARGPIASARRCAGGKRSALFHRAQLVRLVQQEVQQAAAPVHELQQGSSPGMNGRRASMTSTMPISDWRSRT